MLRLVAVLGLLAACAAPVRAQTSTTPYQSAEFKYSVALPTACRHEEGPGTLEAVCALDLDPEASKELASAAAFLLEIDAEQVPTDAKPYTLVEFRDELPEAVCGGGDAGRVVITDIKEEPGVSGVVLTANIACPAIKFLALPARKAAVRYIMAPGFRYRMMVRAPGETLDKLRPVGVAFFNSFKSTAERQP